MKVSGFTFIRNGSELGYPYVESILSALPLCDEFVVNVGFSTDDTLDRIKSINSEKIRIIQTPWNEKISDRGFTFAQQKMIAQYACTGDWAFYIEGDEVIHEDDVDVLRHTMMTHLNNPAVEAIVFDYFHFYGNPNTIAVSPRWYRQEARIIRNTIRSFCPDSLFWVVNETSRKNRYPNAVAPGVNMYHYGWVRTQAQVELKRKQIEKLWGKEAQPFDYGEIDCQTLQRFIGTHPKVVQDWLPNETAELFQANPDYKLSRRDKRHRLEMWIEKYIGFKNCRGNFRLIK